MDLLEGIIMTKLFGKIEFTEQISQKMSENLDSCIDKIFKGMDILGD